MPGSSICLVGGADFSAARESPGKQNATWLALGELSECAVETEPEAFNRFFRASRFTLKVHSVENTGSSALAQKILKAKSSLSLADQLPYERSVFGLDFPFSVPKGFYEFLHPLSDGTAQWQGDTALCSMAFEDLERKAIEYFKLKGGEERRSCDQYCLPMAQSPLHRINPGMLKMTHTGSAVLQELRAAGYAIMPWDGLEIGMHIGSGTLAGSLVGAVRHAVLETYPSAILLWLELPYRKYKEKDEQAAERRSQIWDGLCKLHTVNKRNWFDLKLELEPSLRDTCLSSADALDSVLACLSAAIAVSYPAQTSPRSRQTSATSPSAEPIDPLEGWIYTPGSY